MNLLVSQEECVAIMGSNGSGKTTLVKHLIGLLKPQKGFVRIMGMDTRSTPVSRLARIVGVVFQNPLHQFFNDTVIDEIMVAPRNMGLSIDEKEVQHLLERLGISHLKDKPPHEASLGEQRRIALASVLVYKPKIIVMDEPTVGLDYRNKMRLCEILRELKEEGHTLIIVSHDTEFVARIPVDRIVLMDSGRVLYEGDPRSCFYNQHLLLKTGLTPPQIPELVMKLKLDGRAENKLRPLTEEDFIEIIMGRREISIVHRGCAQRLHV